MLWETWLKDGKPLAKYMAIPDYKFCHRNRNEREGKVWL